MKKYGKLEKVDLHELWDGGVADFTPWLSEEENLSGIAKALGMELVVQSQSISDEGFHGDILCKDTLTDQFVLMGNQLEQTDNAHLGQFLTHAARLETSTIVWIARAFEEEHRTALNWLNKVSNGSIRLFGIEIEAYKIGDSLPAPRFSIILKPTGWTSQVPKPASSQKLTETELLKLEYWHGLKNFMETNNSSVQLLGTPPKSWFNVPEDKGRYFLSVTVNPRESSLNILLNIIGEKANDDFDKLCEIAYKDSLVEINPDVRWYKVQANAGSSVTLKTYADFMEKSDWPNQFAWFKENIEKFDRFFRTRLRLLY